MPKQDLFITDTPDLDKGQLGYNQDKTNIDILFYLHMF